MSFSKEHDKEGKKFPIKITNYVNPHNFYFKLDNVIIGRADADVENELEKHAKAESWSSSTGYQPKEREIVCAHIVDWNKWVRAQIDVIFDLEKGPKKYIIWCLDHGVPMKLGGEHILPMPPHLQRLPVTAYQGGLAKCVPMQKRLDFGKSEYQVENSDRFTEFLSTFAKQLLDEASEVLFKPLQKMGDDHIFGDIQIEKYAGRKVDMLRELVKRDFGVRIDENAIPFGIENWETTKTPRFKTDQGQLNIRQVAYMSLASTANTSKRKKDHRSMLSLCSNDLDEDDKVILNWSRTNNLLARDLDRTNKNHFDMVIDELDRYVMAERQRPDPYHHVVRTAPSFASVNRSNQNVHSMNSSRSTLFEMQSVAGFSDVASTFSARTSSRFTKHLEQISKQPSKSATTKNAPKEVFIPSGFERDILEFHKYNEF